MLFPAASPARRAGTQPTPRTLAEQNMYAIPAGTGGGGGGVGPPPPAAAAGGASDGGGGTASRPASHGRDVTSQGGGDRGGSKPHTPQTPVSPTGFEGYNLQYDLDAYAMGDGLMTTRRSSMPGYLSSGDTGSRASKQSFHLLRARSIAGDKVTSIPMHHDNTEVLREMRATKSTRSFQKLLESRKVAGMATMETDMPVKPKSTPHRQWSDTSMAQSPSRQKLWSTPTGPELFSLPLMEESEAKWNGSDSNSLYTIQTSENNASSSHGGASNGKAKAKAKAKAQQQQQQPQSRNGGASYRVDASPSPIPGLVVDASL